MPPLAGSATERVLVVDDEKSIATTMAEIFARNGFEAQYALSVEDAASLVSHFVPDVVVTDLVMPGDKDGIDLIRDIRNSLPGCRTFLLTAHAGFLPQDARYENVRVIEKPIAPQDLIAIVRGSDTAGQPAHPHVVLLVEDREIKRYSLARWLKHNGFEVREAETGAEALQVARDPVDCVLLDINLPDTNGFAVCQELRQSGVTAPIVHVTATYDDPAAQEQSKHSGADGFVAQPVEPQALLYAVRHYMQLRRLREECKAEQ